MADSLEAFFINISQATSIKLKPNNNPLKKGAWSQYYPKIKTNFQFAIRIACGSRKFNLQHKINTLCLRANVSPKKNWGAVFLMYWSTQLQNYDITNSINTIKNIKHYLYFFMGNLIYRKLKNQGKKDWINWKNRQNSRRASWITL